MRYSTFTLLNPPGSAILVSSNPTNLVIAEAFSISFVGFFVFTVLPVLAAAVATYVALLVTFSDKGSISRSAKFQTQHRPSYYLIDRQGAIFGSIIFVITLAVLIGTSVLGVPVWWVTLPAASIVFIRDVTHDFRKPPGDQRRVRGVRQHLSLEHINNRFKTTSTVLRRLPILLVPFALSTFVLVEALARRGWIAVFAHGWALWANDKGVVGATAGMGLITCILCNVCLFRSHKPLQLTTALDMWN